MFLNNAPAACSNSLTKRRRGLAWAASPSRTSLFCDHSRENSTLGKTTHCAPYESLESPLLVTECTGLKVKAVRQDPCNAAPCKCGPWRFLAPLYPCNLQGSSVGFLLGPRGGQSSLCRQREGNPWPQQWQDWRPTWPEAQGHDGWGRLDRVGALRQRLHILGAPFTLCSV